MLTVPFASDRTSASAHALLLALTYRYVSFLNGTTLTPVVNENLRERIPDGQKRRELPLARRFGADVVTYLDVDELRPLFATKSTSFWYSFPT